MAQLVKNPPVMWETWVRSLAWEDPLEKGKATHSSILAWRIPCTEEPGGLQSMARKESDMTKQLTHTMLFNSGTTWSQVLALPPACCVTLGQARSVDCDFSIHPGRC